ncbi:MFS transporter permease [Endozoicomonas montiporae]|uniref:MFS transporter permease n=2 Tax=Endozoicomonas montiporae TaxID=1027273 RepID=A0A081N2Y7_9GAMM|nr:MFS transporter [Endozoicomonas montiporae]AMO58078.1 multidrug resistance protein [Endozoicomonas montiporae CL-33]KEQ12810.1 MFS transporter permease [Endozoicomonas montiporae]
MIDLNTTEYRRARLALGLGGFLIFCNLYLFQPLLPVMTEAFSVSAARVNWLVAGGTLALSATLIPWAICSEVIGRYKVMMVSLSLLPVVGLMVLATDSLLGMTLARAAMGISLAGFTAVAVAYMAEEFSPKALMIAVGAYVSANSFGGITGRVFGGVIAQYWSWQLAVVVMALFSLAGAIVVYILLPKAKQFSPAPEVSLRSHVRQVVAHIQTPKLWIAMLIGGVNFALFVNLFTVMGLRLVAPPYSMPVSVASMIFLCYLSGSITARLSGHWKSRWSVPSGIFLGTAVSFLGTLVAVHDSVQSMIIGLLLISSGSFFSHSMTYGWVSQKATRARATANALYLVHYYAGGGLGGFYLIACWEAKGWPGVVIGSGGLYTLISFMAIRMMKFERRGTSATRKLSSIESD